MYTLDLPRCDLQTTFSADVVKDHARKKSWGIVEKKCRNQTKQYCNLDKHCAVSYLSSTLSSKSRSILIVMNIIGERVPSLLNVRCPICSTVWTNTSFVKYKSTVTSFYAKDLEWERKINSISVSRWLGNATRGLNRAPYFTWHLRFVTSSRYFPARVGSLARNVNMHLNLLDLAAMPNCINRPTFHRSAGTAIRCSD